MDLKVLEPIRKPLKEFDSPDEFNLFYHKHKDEIDAQTTHILNKKYFINGHRITKIQGVLCLKKVPPKVPKNGDHDSICVQRDNEMTSLMERIQNIEDVLNQVVDVVNRIQK